jgi:flagellar protein FlaF
MLNPSLPTAAATDRGDVTTDQRRLEADVLLKAAGYLEQARGCGAPLLQDALLYNRKLWTMFAAEAADGSGRLPNALRNNIGSLAVFIFRRTFELMEAPEAAKVDALVEINRAIAAGLLNRAEAA